GSRSARRRRDSHSARSRRNPGQREDAMGIFRRKPKHLSPKKQAELDNRLINEAQCGDTETMRTLIAAGAHVHSGDDWALRYAAKDGDTATVQMLLTAGADAHAKDDVALRWAAYHGRTEIVNILAKHIF